VKKWLWPSQGKAVLGLAITLGTTAVVGLSALTWFYGSYKIAPVVIGDSVEEAAAALHEASVRVDTDEAQGTVIDQDPIGGEVVQVPRLRPDLHQRLRNTHHWRT